MGAAAVVQELTWEEALRAGRVLFGTSADALLAGSGWRDELKRAYKRRVLETHPDRALALGRAEAELSREFQAVADAYRLLQEAPDASRWLRPRSPVARRPAPSPRAAEERRAREEAARRAERIREEAAARQAAAKQAAQAQWEAERSARARRGAEEARRAQEARRAEEARAAEARRAEQRRRVWTAAAPDWRHVTKSRPLPRRRVRLAEYLYYSGRISWAVMVEAIAWQRRQRPAVGKIAVDYGFLSPLEVMDVIERRRRAGAGDVPFAEYALRLGMITQFERLAIVGRQSRLQRPIGQFFVERGLVVEPEFDELRREIVRHNLRYWLRSEATGPTGPTGSRPST